MTKTMKINELVSELDGFDSESSIKVWIRGADKDYPITDLFIDSINEDSIYIDIDDLNLVDLSEIWHDASEEPQGYEWHIAYIDVFGSMHSLRCPSVTFDTFPSLAEFAAVVGMQYWAYVSDLLPKGGKK